KNRPRNPPANSPTPAPPPQHPSPVAPTPPAAAAAAAAAATPANGSGSGSGSHPRKLISHIFGRNKTSTKLFPSTVWVHYCRKHYQRARYRSRAWPFTQCELLLDSLGRMEAWGGVESFEVVLRRREMERLSSAEQRQG
ncbi:hypothetical protein KXW97_003218, partial [Aspergillus fumigatus]